ncbi:MAG: AAA family ATPase, partial [Bdellovibrionota bacterium]
MPHRRKRALLSLLEKRLKLFPVVGILGARQTGKSTLLRDLLPPLRAIKYVTLDRDEARSQALRAPSLFLQNLESDLIKTVCIDEVQKAPVLFDTIKAEVDEKKRPGRFAISGSTEFSKKTGIRESLTGRISLLRVFPLNLAEIVEADSCFSLAKGEAHRRAPKIKLQTVQAWLERGGMPGVFAIRESANRDALWDRWVETTCSRALAQFGIPRFNPELARR